MERPVYFKNPKGERLAGTLHLPDSNTDRGVALAHCFTCSRHTRILKQLGQDFAKRGFMALRFDFSGNGQSEGQFTQSTYSKQIEEMRVACDFLSAEGATRIGLIGHSMGAAIALLAAPEIETAKAVCTLAGRFSGTKARELLNRHQQEELDQTGRIVFTSRGRQLTLTQDFFSDADRFDLPAALAGLALPLLVVHGDQDEITPVEEAYAVHKPKAGKLETVIISGGDHMFSTSDHREAVSAQIITWIEKWIFPKP